MWSVGSKSEFCFTFGHRELTGFSRIYRFHGKSIDCLVTPWKFDVPKTSIFALEASLLGKIFVLRTSNFRGATISRYFLDRNTLENFRTICTRFEISEILGRKKSVPNKATPKKIARAEFLILRKEIIAFNSFPPRGKRSPSLNEKKVYLSPYLETSSRL